MELIKDRKVLELAHSLNLFDLDEILDVAIEQIPQILHSHRVSIYLLDHDEEYLVAKRHSSKRLQDHLGEKVAVSSKHSLISQIFIKKKSLLIPNVAEYIIKNNLPIKLSRRQRYTSGSCMLIPIIVRMKNNEKIIGVLNFSEKADFTPFSKIDMEMATHIGEILGTSVHNCQVAEKKLGGQQKELLQELEQVKKAYKEKQINLDEAKKRQSQMQSEAPELEGYDLNVLYSPMETIGGDFYDFIQLNEYELGIVVGDVSGHGIEAALVMSMAKHILSIYIKLHRSLVDTLCQANDEICSSLKGEAFVAVFIGILNTKNHTLRFVRAGQAYPLIYNDSRNKEPFELQSRGMVLGTARGEMFRSRLEEKSFKLMENDIVLIYSDGITEASDEEGNEVGIEGVSTILKEIYTESSESINQKLINHVENYTLGEKQDDITVLTIKASNLSTAIEEEDENHMVAEEINHNSETFILAQDFSFDEEMQYQISSFEEKNFELEQEILKLKDEKEELQKKNAELMHEINLTQHDPDSLIVMLKTQLEVALDLPKDLISENKLLNEIVKKQKDELQKLEVEFNELSTHLEYINNERRDIAEESTQMENIVTFLAEKLTSSKKAIQNEIINANLKLDRITYEKIMEGDYQGVYQHFEVKFQEALNDKDYTKVDIMKKQIFTVSNIFYKHLNEIVSIFSLVNQ